MELRGPGSGTAGQCGTRPLADLPPTCSSVRLCTSGLCICKRKDPSSSLSPTLPYSPLLPQGQRQGKWIEPALLEEGVRQPEGLPVEG